MNDKVSITVDGRRLTAQTGQTVLDVARQAGIYIPALCAHENLEPAGACRLCIVEVSGSLRPGIRTSCVQEVQEGLVVETDSDRLFRNRRMLVELLLGRAPDSQAIIDLARKFGIKYSRFPTGESDDCIRCGLCVRVCNDKMNVHALCFAHRGHERRVTTEFDHLSRYCIGCGACANICPTGAIKMEDRGLERKISMWGQVMARFKLERCEVCGGPKPPDRLVEFIRDNYETRLGQQMRDKLCHTFARESRAKLLARIPGAPREE